MKSISRLHIIVTNAQQAEQVCVGGGDWIQLRLKNVSYAEYYRIGKEVQAVCNQNNATFIVNDNIKLALDLQADGVHVGKEDQLPQSDIDKMLGRDGIIGCTANTIEDFEHLQGKPVSYIGLGPYRFTTTKQNLSAVLGMNGYRKLFAQLQARHITPPPVIGIGGITTDDVSVLMSTGLHGIAVAGAITGAPDITQATHAFRDFLDPTGKQVNKTITIDATVAKAWQTITQPSLMKDWLNDSPIEVMSNWEKGNSITFKGSFHNKPYEDKGIILEYEPEQVFSYSYWNKLSALPDTPENYTIIEFRLKPIEGRTELTLTQNNFKSDTSYRHWNFYWTLTIDRLKKAIETT